MVKVSIIMPVYNSQEYLRGAVNTVLSQDFDSFELIMVDDGSKDNSGQICDEIAREDNRVKVIHKQNGGICSARNAGIKIAQGEYVGFCDNDDEYLPNLLKDNYSLAKKYDADIMRFNRIRREILADGKCMESIIPTTDQLILHENYGKKIYELRRHNNVWAALYRKDIIDKYNICFNENFKYGLEDVCFNVEFLMHSNSVGLNKKPYYVWSQRVSHSTSKTFHRESLKDCIYLLERENEFIKSIDNVNYYDLMKYICNEYIYWLIQYLNDSKEKVPRRVRNAVFTKIRENEMFDRKLLKGYNRTLFKENKIQWFILNTFYRRKFDLMYHVTAIGSSILSLRRYK